VRLLANLTSRRFLCDHKNLFQDLYQKVHSAYLHSFNSPTFQGLTADMYTATRTTASADRLIVRQSAVSSRHVNHAINLDVVLCLDGNRSAPFSSPVQRMSWRASSVASSMSQMVGSVHGPKGVANNRLQYFFSWCFFDWAQSKQRICKQWVKNDLDTKFQKVKQGMWLDEMAKTQSFCFTNYIIWSQFLQDIFPNFPFSFYSKYSWAGTARNLINLTRL